MKFFQEKRDQVTLNSQIKTSFFKHNWYKRWSHRRCSFSIYSDQECKRFPYDYLPHILDQIKTLYLTLKNLLIKYKYPYEFY